MSLCFVNGAHQINKKRKLISLEVEERRRAEGEVIPFEKFNKKSMESCQVGGGPHVPRHSLPLLLLFETYYLQQTFLIKNKQVFSTILVYILKDPSPFQYTR